MGINGKLWKIHGKFIVLDKDLEKRWNEMPAFQKKFTANILADCLRQSYIEIENKFKTEDPSASEPPT